MKSWIFTYQSIMDITQDENGTDVVTSLNGIPLGLLVTYSALALLGIVYSIVLIAFNMRKAKLKIIKMTSPNVNVIILCGVVVGFGCVVIAGIDSRYVTLRTMEILQQTVACVLPVTLSLVFGLLFAKSWRVFLVFKNLNFNGSMARDEHLLLGVVVMATLDLAIVLPWSLLDPIQCRRRVVSIEDQVRASTVHWRRHYSRVPYIVLLLLINLINLLESDLHVSYLSLSAFSNLRLPLLFTSGSSLKLSSSYTCRFRHQIIRPRVKVVSFDV